MSSAERSNKRIHTTLAIYNIMKDGVARNAATIYALLRARDATVERSLVFSILETEARSWLGYNSLNGIYHIRPGVNKATIEQQPSPSVWEATDDRESAPPMRDAPLLQRVIALLEDGHPRKASQIARELSMQARHKPAIPSKAISSMLWREGKGIVERNADTYLYSLVAGGAAPRRIPPPTREVPLKRTSQPGKDVSASRTPNASPSNMPEQPAQARGSRFSGGGTRRTVLPQATHAYRPKKASRGGEQASTGHTAASARPTPPDRILTEIESILSDGRARKADAIAAELTRRSTQGTTFTTHQIVRLLWDEGRPLVQRDPDTYVYTLKPAADEPAEYADDTGEGVGAHTPAAQASPLSEQPAPATSALSPEPMHLGLQLFLVKLLSDGQPRKKRDLSEAAATHFGQAPHVAYRMVSEFLNDDTQTNIRRIPKTVTYTLAELMPESSPNDAEPNAIQETLTEQQQSEGVDERADAVQPESDDVSEEDTPAPQPSGVILDIVNILQDGRPRTIKDIADELTQRAPRKPPFTPSLVGNIIKREGKTLVQRLNGGTTYTVVAPSATISTPGAAELTAPAPPMALGKGVARRIEAQPLSSDDVPQPEETSAPDAKHSLSSDHQKDLYTIFRILAEGKPLRAMDIAQELTRRSSRKQIYTWGTVTMLLRTEIGHTVRYDAKTQRYSLQEAQSYRQNEQPASAAGYASPVPTPIAPQPTVAVNHEVTAAMPDSRTTKTRQAPAFSVLTRVRLRAQPTQRGRIIAEPRPYAGGYEYFVAIDNDERWYLESDLETVGREDVPRWQDHDAFLRDMLLARLRGQFSDSLYAYRASRTEFVPYQFRPVLKFLRNPDQRILIADEVGLGKTIEATLIYLELKARLNISRVLVLCPSRLKRKWHDELRDRFEEEFTELDTPQLRRFIDESRRLGNRIPFRGIASFEMMRSPEFTEAWTELGIQLDLLIVDEAHYMRNAGTRTYHLGTALTDAAEAVIFLTATPLHLGNQDLFHLLRLLSPGDFDSLELFESLIAPNTAINRAGQLLAARQPSTALTTLRTVEESVLRERFLKNPYYHDVIRRLTDGTSSDRERIMLQRDLLELNTLGNIFTRTRKREVSNAAVRAAYSVQVEFTPEERAFYERVIDDVQSTLYSGDGQRSFSTIMRERQAASCLAAMREALEESTKTHRAAELQIEHSEYDVLDEDTSVQHRGSGGTLPVLHVDSKLAAFIQTLREALLASPQSKILVFSFFRRTLDYLHRQLRAKGYQVALLNGSIPVGDRTTVMDRFRNDPDIRILLSSEVGAEGLDFQFCDILVNYDLPWNPMQVEQRIGRLDRFGQQHERIRIYNFYIVDTIETRIFQRLYDRIGIFERSVGDLEAILGAEIRQLSQEALDPHLSPREQEVLAEQAASRIVRHQLEAEELERHKDQLIGQEAIINQQIDDTIRSGRIISPEEIQALVRTFLTNAFPRLRIEEDAEEPCWSLRANNGLREHLERSILAEPQEQRNTRFLETLRRGNDIALTFDSDLARQRPFLEFITIRHPVARAAIEYWQSQGLTGVPATHIVLNGPHEEAGDGYFFIYQITVGGVRPQTLLHSLIVRDDMSIAKVTSTNVFNQLAHSKSSQPLSVSNESFSRAQGRADAETAEYRDTLKQEAVQRNTALVAAQQASVQTSFEARIRRTTKQFEEAYDERIRRMRRAEIANLESRLAQRLTDIQAQSSVTVSSALIAGGSVRIVPETAKLPTTQSTSQTNLLYAEKLSIEQASWQNPKLTSSEPSKSPVVRPGAESPIDEQTVYYLPTAAALTPTVPTSHSNQDEGSTHPNAQANNIHQQSGVSAGPQREAQLDKPYFTIKDVQQAPQNPQKTIGFPKPSTDSTPVWESEAVDRSRIVPPPDREEESSNTIQETVQPEVVQPEPNQSLLSRASSLLKRFRR